VEDIFEFLWHGGLNPYDLYRTCDPSPAANSKKLGVMQRGLTPRFMLERGLLQNNTTPMRSNNLYQVQRAGRNRTRGRNTEEAVTGSSSVPCMNDTALAKYMNSEGVRNALHISSQAPQWEICRLIHSPLTKYIIAL